MALSSSDPHTQLNAIVYLGAHAKNDPEARETLKQIVRSEKNIRVRSAAEQEL